MIRYLKELIEALQELNTHLADIKTMVAPLLGWEVKENNE